MHENTKTQTRVRERVKRGDATKLKEASVIFEGLFPVFTKCGSSSQNVAQKFPGGPSTLPQGLRSKLFSK